MFRKFSRSSKKRSSDSAAQPPHVSNLPSRSSAPLPRYSPRSSVQTTGSLIQAPRTSDQAPRSYTQSPCSFDQRSRLSEQAPGYLNQSPRFSDQRPNISDPISGYFVQSPGCYAHSPRSSDQRPRISDQTSAYFTQSPHSSVQGPRTSDQAPGYYTNSPRSSASTPYAYPPHPLSPPPPNIPYDIAAWSTHDAKLSSLLTKATNLDNLACTAELRWKAAEAVLPPSRQHEVGVFAKIPVLRDVHVVLRQVRKLGRTEKKWRMQWMPRSPKLKYPAWGSCYAEAVEVYEGEGVRPEFVVGILEEKMEALAGIVRGWIEEEIWGREWGVDG